jgi:hypothetical protein
MSLSRDAVETLIDLVEIKLSCFEVYDRDDARELRSLERCRNQLRDLAASPAALAPAIVEFPARGRRRRATA